jgi:hypothetical protein
MSILKMLQSKPTTAFDFIDLQKELDGDGKIIVSLTLKEPIPLVTGSITINNRGNGDSLRVTLSDVTTVKIHQRNIEELDKDVTAGKAKFEWDEATKKGHLACDFRLDASQNEECWLTKESFAAFRRNETQNRRALRTTNLAAKARESITRAELKNADKPEPVAGS